MNPTIQFGTHPDAESLTAFAEQVLSNAEREQILAHIAVCNRCREVVFLVHRAMEAEEPVQVSVERVAPGQTNRRLSRSWRWAWVPVGALAGFVGFATVQHVRHVAVKQQMARSEQRTEPASGPFAAGSANVPAKQQAPNRDHSPMRSPVPQGTRAVEEKGASAADKKKAARQKDESKLLDDSRREVAGFSGGVVSGIGAARAKSSPVGGPMAQNQMQQQNYATQQNALAQEQAANEMANKPSAPASLASGARRGAVTETVQVQPVQQASAASATPAAAPQLTMIPVTGQHFDLARDQGAKLKESKVSLPSGIGTLSVATSAQRIIALDTAGALYLSEDAGKHWQPVKTQWTGRAVLLKARQLDAVSGVLSIQAPQFELVNDKLQTWVSNDGKAWKEQVLPEK